MNKEGREIQWGISTVELLVDWCSQLNASGTSKKYSYKWDYVHIFLLNTGINFIVRSYFCLLLFPLHSNHWNTL